MHTRTLLDRDRDLAVEPELVDLDGRFVWRWPSGRTIPVVRGGDGDATFTQTDVDRIVQQRVAKLQQDLAAAQANGKPADYDQLKAELAQLKSQGQTEAQQLRGQLETAQQQIATLTTERDTAVAERDTAKGDVTTERKRNAVLSQAAIQRAADPSDVWALLTDVDKNALTIGDDGQVTGADAAVKQLLEAKPHLVGTTAGHQRDPGQGKRDTPKTGREAGLAEARRRFPQPEPAGAQQ